MTDDPITEWISEFRGGSELAAQNLWNHFWKQMCELARRKINANSRRLYDEEDAALSAFNSFAKGLAAGRFPKLDDRDSLMRLLLVITTRKVLQRHRHDRQLQRDVRATLTEAIFTTESTDEGAFGIFHIEAREPTPELAASFVETCNLLFERLGDSELREIAMMRMEGCNDGEIAKRLDCSRSTIQRRLEIVRRECVSLDEENGIPRE